MTQEEWFKYFLKKESLTQKEFETVKMNKYVESIKEISTEHTYVRYFVKVKPDYCDKVDFYEYGFEIDVPKENYWCKCYNGELGHGFYRWIDTAPYNEDDKKIYILECDLCKTQKTEEIFLISNT